MHTYHLLYQGKIIHTYVNIGECTIKLICHSLGEGYTYTVE